MLCKKLNNGDLNVLKYAEKELSKDILEYVTQCESAVLIEKKLRNLKILKSIIHEDVTLKTIGERYGIGGSAVSHIFKRFVRIACNIYVSDIQKKERKNGYTKNGVKIIRTRKNILHGEGGPYHEQEKLK